MNKKVLAESRVAGQSRLRYHFRPFSATARQRRVQPYAIALSIFETMERRLLPGPIEIALAYRDQTGSRSVVSFHSDNGTRSIKRRSATI